MQNREIDYGSSRDLPAVLYLDVRSPLEFAVDHIPGAVNVPILDDAQRAIVGTLYRQEGPAAAWERARAEVSPRLEEILAEIQERARGRSLVVYCWRGGARSQVVLEFLDHRGIPAWRLGDGYKGYRRYVRETLETMDYPPFATLYGLTGCGKTRILEILEEQGAGVLHLERAANHRGSVFGGVGRGDQPSQKAFESTILASLRAVPAGTRVFIEGESRRIGRLFIPEPLFGHLRAAPRILVYDTLENRTGRILREYLDPAGQGELRGALRHLTRRLGKTRVEGYLGLLEGGQTRELVRSLLAEYYDPLYRHPDQAAGGYHACVDAADPHRAAREIQDIMETRRGERADESWGGPAEGP